MSGLVKDMMHTDIGFISVSAVPDEAFDEPPRCTLVNKKLTKARNDEREDMSDNEEVGAVLRHKAVFAL